MIIKVSPHFDDDASTVDIQRTNNIFGSWTAVITDDAVTNYPKKFNDNLITDDTFIRFRIKDTGGEYSDWSIPEKAKRTNKPEGLSGMCFVYGRLKDVNTAKPINSEKITFVLQGGPYTSTTDIVREVLVETDDYGWFGVYLTPGTTLTGSGAKTYEAIALKASIKKIITVPAQKNVKFSSL